MKRQIKMVEGGFALVMKRAAYYEGGKFILNIPSLHCQAVFIAGGLMLRSIWKGRKAVEIFFS